LRDNAPLKERLNTWMTLVHRGQVLDAYRTFLGLMEDTAHRKEVLAELVFAGLIDVQDRMLFNRSYTTGTRRIALARRWRSQRDRLGRIRRRTTCCMPARSTWRWGRAGTPPMRWPATW